MLNTYIAPGVLARNFLRPTGILQSIDVAESHRQQVEGIVGTVRGLERFYIHWIARELDHHKLWDWHDEDEAVNKAERKKLEELSNALVASVEPRNTLRDALEVISYMKELTVKYGERVYQKMVSFDNGEAETDAGNNRMFQSSRLAECILLAIRLGVESETTERWKTKLKEGDTASLQKNIFPEE